MSLKNILCGTLVFACSLSFVSCKAYKDNNSSKAGELPVSVAADSSSLNDYTSDIELNDSNYLLTIKDIYDHFDYYNGKTIEKTYEVAIAFKTVVYSDKGFKYYNYTNFSDVQELNDFIENCRKLEFYNTGIDINYGDKLITLSTCEYSQKNGRIVVVAKQI